MIAPTPLPFAFSCANSGSRSSTFSKSIVIRSPPRPSGIFTFACQWRSSLISKPSTPGISFAICAGSFSTCQTTSRGALSSFVPSTFMPAPPRRSRASTPGPAASTRRGGRGCSCRRRSARPPACSASWIAEHDAVDPAAAALAHPLRAERRERGRRLDRAGLQRRHVERVRHVVVVEVRGQQLPVLVVDEVLVERGADRVHGRAVHLALDDLRVDPRAAVVDGRVVDDLDDAGLAVDLDDARVDLRRVGQRQLPVFFSVSTMPKYGR